uniref:Uncharacterized protein MANES_04G078800 n=1 Tax=Rhizophora mucronata TaxID=61149 RepID=A0A2P2L7D3_RHIMU
MITINSFYSQLLNLKEGNGSTMHAYQGKLSLVISGEFHSKFSFNLHPCLLQVFDLYGVGLRQGFSTPNLLKELNFKIGKLSTGDSLDLSSHDEEAIMANDATVKDIEGAAVAYVADFCKVPVIFVKAVTDIVDGDKPTAEEFLQNLAAVTSALDQAIAQIVDFINGKSISEL